MTDLSGLIERVEAATGPDRSIDAAIYHDLLGFCRHANKERTGAQSDTGFDCMDCGADSWGNKSRKGGYPAGQGLNDTAPRYTASTDAALMLVPEFMVWGACSSWDDDNTPYAWVLTQAKPDGTNYIHESRAATPALAIVAASLRAQKEQSDED